MSDAKGRRVRAVGSHGTPFEPLAKLRPTLLDTPVAQKALLSNQVIVVSEQIEQAVPPEYAALLGITRRGPAASLELNAGCGETRPQPTEPERHN